MRLLKFLFCLLLCVMAVIFVSCGQKTGRTEDTSNVSDSTSETVLETDPGRIVENITMEQLKNYTLIRQEDASDEIVQAGVTLREAFIDSLGVTLNLKSDLHSENVPALRIGEYEILLGNCDRDESRQFMADLKINDYGYAMIGKKLVICGGSEDATLTALKEFIANVIRKHDASADLFYDGSVQVLHRGTYEISEFTLQGSDIAEYAVVYPNKNESCKALANELIDQIADKSGIQLTLRNDKEATAGKEILIGTTNRTGCKYTAQTLSEGSYLIGADNQYICARGADGIGDYYAVYALISALLDQVSPKQNIILSDETIETVPMGDSLKAMSFNVWVSSPTAERKESVTQTILAYMPDTIGVQEASPTWMGYLHSSIGSIYDYVGLGRDGGTSGEHSAIFYRKDRFELIETGTKWMSATPDVVSKFKESSLNRVFTYAILLEKKTNTEIMVVNTHLEHTSAEARNLQVAVLMNFLKNYTDYPIVLTGDFNANPESEVYRMVTAQLADSSKIAQKSEQHYTFHNYGKSSTYIDYAFVSQKNIAVSHYRVITEEMNGMLPSDHYALVIDYRVLK